MQLNNLSIALSTSDCQFSRDGDGDTGNGGARNLTVVFLDHSLINPENLAQICPELLELFEHIRMHTYRE